MGPCTGIHSRRARLILWLSVTGRCSTLPPSRSWSWYFWWGLNLRGWAWPTGFLAPGRLARGPAHLPRPSSCPSCMRSAAPLHITSTPSSRIRLSPFLLSPPAQSLLCGPIDDPVALGAGFRALHDITISRQPGQTALTALRSPPSSVLPTTSTTVFLFNVFVLFFVSFITRNLQQQFPFCALFD